MEKKFFAHHRIVFLVLILALCSLPIVAFASTREYFDEPKLNGQYNERYHYIVETTSISSYENLHSVAVENKDITDGKATIDYHSGWDWVNKAGISGEIEEVVKVEAGGSWGKNGGTAVKYEAPVKPHRVVTLTVKKETKTFTITTKKTLQRAPLYDPNNFIDVDGTTSVDTKNPSIKREVVTSEGDYLSHEEDTNRPRFRNADGVYTHYYCKIPGCPEPNSKIELKYGNHTCVHAGQTCSRPGADCPTCGKYGTPTGCVFDYSHAYGEVGWGSYIYFLCTNYDGTANGCWNIEKHYHTFDCSYPVKLPEKNEFRQIPGNFEKHEQKFMEPRGCSYMHCDDVRDFEVWLPRKHSWKLIESKPETCIHDGYEKWQCTDCELIEHIIVDANGDHDYDYKNPKSVAYNVVIYQCKTPGCGAYEDHTHNFVNTGDADEPTNSYRPIAENATQHERKYLVSQKCTGGAHCNDTRKIEKWVKESHTTWTTTDYKKATCYQNGYEKKACDKCGFEKTTTINATGDHVYDYSNPESVAYNVVIYHCKTPGCGAYKDHTHSYAKTAGSTDQRTETLRQVSGSTTQHERKYLQSQTCASCGSTRTVDVWVKENHSFANNGSEVKTNTLRKSTASQHERKYTQAQKCSCGESKTAENWKKENHSFANNGSEVKTNTLRKSTASQHERKYTQAQTCSCGESKTVESWKKENHSFANNGSEVKTNTLRKLNASQHERKYTQAQKCSCGESKTVESWKKENHSFANNGSEVKTTTLRKLNASQHERKYTQAQACSCGESKTVETWKKENHSFSNNGSASSTASYRQVSGNTSQHERKYTQPQKCSCTYTKTVDVWNKESHSWVQKGETHGNCVTPTIKGYQCSKCSMTKSENGAKDPNNHIALASRYTTVTKPTCTAAGSGYYPCSACGGRVNTTIAATGHSWNSGTIIVYPTVSMPGQKRYTCTKCGATQTRSYR